MYPAWFPRYISQICSAFKGQSFLYVSPLFYRSILEFKHWRRNVSRSVLERYKTECDFIFYKIHTYNTLAFHYN